ncbi:UDP-galactopyranose mutase [Dorea acetigenes]|uniref:UDP-galactopyranose mutase n=1 Tax=Dorea acetigenes TaxID=2981787 RepID=A0ABT2RKX8_9FIRM|nr:UDP-galactopyranose mutase [Dorea acetigenes]MCU6686063.1 UDP-galactopyranose mutase [Dorea acetigenes]SCI77582.1 UDP-galactopyranose mutase [uncultured Clostridium sp.]
MKVEDYKYIVAGAGIFGAIIAERLASKGNHVLVVEKRDHIAGNIYSYTDEKTGIEVHKYGSHIFHTELDEVWDYITKFTEFNDYTHTVNTRYNGELYPMPINLDTINKLYGTNMDAEEAEKFVAEEAAKTGITDPKNFEEKGLSLVGEKLYTAFLKGYTEKQWNTSATNLSAEILKRIPVRFSHDNRYFITAKHQGIPKEGYTKMVANILDNDLIEVCTNTSFQDIESEISADAKIIYCGQIDQFMNYELGVLPWRSLRFEEVRTEETLGEAVINEADPAVPYTRSHDYKYYQIHQSEVVNQKACYICREYPADFEKGGEVYYPVNNDESEALYQKYVAAVKEKYPNMILGGRLGAYRYWDMDIAIKNALELAEKL